jgi:uroporphyrinogen-III decarboxylase
MEIGKPGGAYIFNTGDMVPRDVPEENMQTMIRTARQHGGY